jgi:hypothetical protein
LHIDWTLLKAVFILNAPFSYCYFHTDWSFLKDHFLLTGLFLPGIFLLTIFFAKVNMAAALWFVVVPTCLGFYYEVLFLQEYHLEGLDPGSNILTIGPVVWGAMYNLSWMRNWFTGLLVLHVFVYVLWATRVPQRVAAAEQRVAGAELGLAADIFRGVDGGVAAAAAPPGPGGQHAPQNPAPNANLHEEVGNVNANGIPAPFPAPLPQERALETWADKMDEAVYQLGVVFSHPHFFDRHTREGVPEEDAWDAVDPNFLLFQVVVPACKLVTAPVRSFLGCTLPIVFIISPALRHFEHWHATMTPGVCCMEDDSIYELLHPGAPYPRGCLEGAHRSLLTFAWLEMLVKLPVVAKINIVFSMALQGLLVWSEHIWKWMDMFHDTIRDDRYLVGQRLNDRVLG